MGGSTNTSTSNYGSSGYGTGTHSDTKMANRMEGESEGIFSIFKPTDMSRHWYQLQIGQHGIWSVRLD